MRNIHFTNTKAGKIDQGILGIETDVLYQWRTLVPTYERRLTPISGVFLDHIGASDVKFVSRILGQKDQPVQNVSLKHITTGTVQQQKNIHENVLRFSDSD